MLDTNLRTASSVVHARANARLLHLTELSHDCIESFFGDTFIIADRMQIVHSFSFFFFQQILMFPSLDHSLHESLFKPLSMGFRLEHAGLVSYPTISVIK